MKKLLKKLTRFLFPRSVFRFVQKVYQNVMIRYGFLKGRIKAIIRVKFNLPLKKTRSKINFEFHLAEHCNLNCASCDNFSPLAEPEYIDIEVFKRDLARMAEIFNHDECERIGFIGGEPLLYPDIENIFTTARKIFPSCPLYIITNGLLLTQMKDSFWKSCRDNRIMIKITHYPVKIDLPKIRGLAEKFGVELDVNDEPISMFRNEPVDLKGSGDYKINFAQCFRGNGCIILREGHLFTCTFAANIHHFNKRFGVNIPITEEDYVDIYDEKITAGEILRRLASPIPMCRFCNMRFKRIDWHQSERKIEEWT